MNLQKSINFKFNRKNILLVSAAAVILIFGLVMSGGASTGDPGSVSDPLVTRSYVDKYVQWQVVDLNPGKQLIGKAGVEMIVRVGSVTVVDPVGSGIPDVTAGINVRAGQKVSLDHHLIVPRTDGRGIRAQTKAVVMYRGEAEVK